VVRVSDALADQRSTLVGFDANPVMLLAVGEGAVAVDALVFLGAKHSSADTGPAAVDDERVRPEIAR
jgi:hypothetical protein